MGRRGAFIGVEGTSRYRAGFLRSTLGRGILRIGGAAQPFIGRIAPRDRQFRASAGFRHEWAPARLRELLESFRKNDPDSFAHLNDLLGSPPASELVCAATKALPEWLRNANGEVWDVLARTAESQGDWTAASEAWENLAELKTSSFARSGSLVCAAIAAKLAANTGRY